MVATTGFNAGIDTSDVEVAFKREVAYGEARNLQIPISGCG